MDKTEVQEIVKQALAAEKRRQFKKKLILVATTAIFAPVFIYAASIAIPNSFSDGDTLSANKLNENFDTLKTRLPPVGAIIAWHKSLPGVPASLPSDFVECNGQTLSDSESSLNGQIIPNLNGLSSGANSPGQTTKEKMFLRGDTSSGTGETDAFKSHQHAGSIRTLAQNAAGFGTYLTPAPDYAEYRSLVNGGSIYYTGNVGDTETRPKNMSVVWIIRVK